MLIATLLLWSGNWIVARAVRDDVAPGIATVGRLAVVIALLLPFCYSGLSRKIPSLGKKDWQILAALGLTGGGVHLALQWLGLHYTTAASGILYLSTTPIFILLLALPLGESIRLRQWLGVALSFSGVFLIATQGDVTRLSFNIGDLMALASMSMWAGYTVLLRVRRDPLNIVELLVMVCGFGMLFMVPWVVFEAFFTQDIRMTEKGVLAILYSAIASLLLAYAGWSYVVSRIGAARAGVTLHLMPAFGIVLSAYFLGEYPSWYHFAGIVLILAGVVLAASGRSLIASSASSSR
jgi:drug/metabolite transporter (DMT)-like permease